MRTTDAQAAFAQARSAFAAGRAADALAELERAAAARADAPATHWAGVAKLARELGDDDLALLAGRRLLASAPDDRTRRILVMELAADTGAAEEAVAMGQALAADAPSDPIPPFSVGINLSRLGKAEEAIEAFRRSLALMPACAPAWEQIALLKRFSSDADPDIAAMEKLAAALAGKPDAALMHYALGKSYDDLGDIDRAFDCFARGAALIAGPRAPRLAPLLAQSDDVRAAFPSPQPELPEARTHAPILIIGNARSGTTLVERILATHPALIGGGELKMLRLACLSFSTPTPAAVAAYVKRAGGERGAWTQVRQVYLARLRARFGRDEGVVDKGLINFLYAGAFARAFPQGRIIHVMRDAMDVAWSCFRTRFRDGLLWSYHVDALAAFMRVYRDLASHWLSLYPERVTTVDYERLVSAPDAETARLFAWLGLETPADWRGFSEARSPVLTASLMQVRRPIYADAMGSWRRYGAKLGPLRDALGRQGLLTD